MRERLIGAWEETDPGLSDAGWGIASAILSGAVGLLAWKEAWKAAAVAVAVGLLFGFGRLLKNVVTIRSRQLEEENRRLRDRVERPDETREEVLRQFLQEAETIKADITTGNFLPANSRARNKFGGWQERVEEYLKSEFGLTAVSRFHSIQNPDPSQPKDFRISIGAAGKGKALKKEIDRRMEALREIMVEVEGG